MANDSLTTNFSSDEISGTSTSGSTELELDDDYHLTLYLADKTEFYRTQEVYLKVKPQYSVESYEIIASDGSCTKFSQGNVETITENLSFPKTSSATLSYLPIGNVSYTWKAGSGTVLIDGRTVSVNKPVVGILECVYDVNFDRLKLTVPATFTGYEVMVVVGSELYGYADLTVSYVNITGSTSSGSGDPPEQDLGLADVIITIKDIYTNEIIPYADIRISKGGTSIYSGSGNILGRVVVSNLVIGEVYDIEVSKADYIDSGDDYLSNDTFTVSAET